MVSNFVNVERNDLTLTFSDIDVNEIKMQGMRIPVFRCPKPDCLDTFTRRPCVERHVATCHEGEVIAMGLGWRGHVTLRTARWGTCRANYSRRDNATIAADRAAGVSDTVARRRAPPRRPVVPHRARLAPGPTHAAAFALCPTGEDDDDDIKERDDAEMARTYSQTQRAMPSHIQVAPQIYLRPTEAFFRPNFRPSAFGQSAFVRTSEPATAEEIARFNEARNSHRASDVFGPHILGSTGFDRRPAISHNIYADPWGNVAGRSDVHPPVLPENVQPSYQAPRLRPAHGWAQPVGIGASGSWSQQNQWRQQSGQQMGQMIQQGAWDIDSSSLQFDVGDEKPGGFRAFLP